MQRKPTGRGHIQCGDSLTGALLETKEEIQSLFDSGKLVHTRAVSLSRKA